MRGSDSSRTLSRLGFDSLAGGARKRRDNVRSAVGAGYGAQRWPRDADAVATHVPCACGESGWLRKSQPLVRQIRSIEPANLGARNLQERVWAFGIVGSDGWTQDSFWRIWGKGMDYRRR